MTQQQTTRAMTDDSHPNDTENCPDDHQQAVEASEYATNDDFDTSDVHIDRVFETGDDAPYEKQRRISRYLSQETRHHVIQAILGHPEHLPSLTELDYYVPKSRSAIRDQLDSLQEHQIIDKYTHTPNEDDRDLPADFWGLTPFGVELLFEYKYLRGGPIMRALHDHTLKTGQVERHETAPRPALPNAVTEALEYDEPDIGETGSEDGKTTMAELRELSIFADAAPAASETAAASTDNETDKERTLDELF